LSEQYWTDIKSLEGIAFFLMPEPIKILTVEIEDDGLVVTLSDGTVAGYVVEELLELRPHRELNRPIALNTL
jgi:hypothetical protein